MPIDLPSFSFLFLNSHWNIPTYSFFFFKKKIELAAVFEPSTSTRDEL